MENKHLSELMATLDCLELTAADLLDTVASARAEIKQTFGEASNQSNMGMSA